jgi:hypothetical protein
MYARVPSKERVHKKRIIPVGRIMAPDRAGSLDRGDGAIEK